VPAEKAFSIAKAMQGTKGCTNSVICGLKAGLIGHLLATFSK